jgi:hypothetical protein
MIFEPTATVEHRVPANRANWRYFRSRCYFEGRSKALVSALQGSQKALSAERAYTLKTLPGGVLRGLRDTLRGDPAGLGRALAIVAGLAITTAGYAAARLLSKSGIAGPAVAGQWQQGLSG